MVYIVGAHFRASNGVAHYQILICFDHPEEGIETYRKRWQIETLYKGLKSSGFDIEKTHLNDTQRIERLLALVCIAFTWAYLVGIHKDINVKPLRILKHGYAEKSLVKYGLEEIADVLARPFRTPNFDVFKFLSCS